MTVLRKLWWGLYPLPMAFWVFYVCGFFAFFLLFGLLFALSYHQLRPIAYILGLCVIWTYMFIASVGVWRSAGVRMTSPIWMVRAWAIGARVVVGFYALGFLWRLINGGALSFMALITGPMDF